MVITYAAWNAQDRAVEVAAFAQNLNVSDGQCTLTLTMGAATRTASNAAISNVTTTQCGTISVPGGQLSAGTWTGRVSFSSAEGSGSSPSVAINVTP